MGTDPPRVVWQCSYEGEVLEHYRMSSLSSTIYADDLSKFSTG